ncbi:MAG TPA: PLDc N-terminal domain-containing protein [Chitinophagaceae bacterium]|nr:PLDc N-terminal domain-containing protein [Chitinophagaceae bacterium]
MKRYSLLILLAASFVLFLTGISIVGPQRPIHIIFVIAGIVLGFIFYLVTLLSVIRSSSMNSGQKTLWIIAIVCLPMIGNMLYVIIYNSVASKQIPKPEI